MVVSYVSDMMVCYDGESGWYVILVLGWCVTQMRQDDASCCRVRITCYVGESGRCIPLVSRDDALCW